MTGMKTFSGLLILISVMVFAGCSSDVDESATKAPAEEREAASAAPQQIDGFMGINWYEGKEALLDNPSYEYNDFGYGVERFKYTGSPRYIEYYDVELDNEKYSFLDGEFYDGEVGGSKPADIDKMHKVLVEAFGQPQREKEGLYFWQSDSGTIVLQAMDERWRMIGSCPKSSISLDY